MEGNPNLETNLNVYNNITKQWEKIEDVVR